MHEYTHLRALPIAGALGAEIEGVDLSRPISDAVFADIHQALMDHKVIFFRDQDLSPARHIAFGRRFGEPHEDHFVAAHDQHPELIELLQEADDAGYNFGGSWHTDNSYRSAPPMAVVLYARELPPFGGDTTWANMALAFHKLSPAMQDMLRPLRAEHLTQGYQQKLKTGGGDYGISFDKAEKVRIEISHPVVRVHPVTGEESLYLNHAYSYRFAGMTEEESAPLIRYLCDFAIRPAFTCRFRWRPGSLAVWDNRSTMHFAIGDYYGYRRLMHRYTVKGDVPVGPDGLILQQQEFTEHA